MKLATAAMLVVGLSALLSADPLLAQWTPVVAKIRQTHQTVVSGKVVRNETKEGEFYRSSDGSVLRHWKTVNGDEGAAGQGDLLDNKKHAFYNLNYNTKRAYQVRTGIPQPSPYVFSKETLQSRGEESIEGVRCTIVPVDTADSGVTERDAGRSCVSSEYGLQLRTEVTVKQGGTEHRTLIEMYDLRINQEPDPKIFDLGSQFTVFKAEPPKAPPN